MSSMRTDIELYRSPDNRLRTSFYEKSGRRAFSLSERTAFGVLLTEFSEDGEVFDQHCIKEKDHLGALAKYLGLGSPVVVDVDAYEKVSANAACGGCSGRGLARELDLVAPEAINNVPVVPIFVCRSCKQKSYSMTESYLRNLVKSNAPLFTEEERKELDADENKFIGVLQEYIIRIFASKKISRLKIG